MPRVCPERMQDGGKGEKIRKGRRTEAEKIREERKGRGKKNGKRMRKGKGEERKGENKR